MDAAEPKPVQPEPRPRRPKLTLDNYDAPGCENQRYILTSPRSLRACARLGIKPVELLPKSFSDFKQGLDFTGLSHTSLLEAYAEYETQRKEKLRAAKKERVKLRQAEQRLQWRESADTFTKEPSIDQERSTCHPVNTTQLSEKDKRILGTLQIHLIKKFGGAEFLHCEQDRSEAKSINIAAKGEEMKFKHKEERLRFECSKHDRSVSKAMLQQCMVQSIEERHSSAEERYQNVCANKVSQIRKSRENRLLRSVECRLAAECLESSFEKWRNELDLCGRLSLERAHNVVQQALTDKRTKLHNNRKERERKYLASRERVEREHQAKLEDWERKTQEWRERVEALDQQKMAEVEKSRAMAHYSATLRTKLKAYTSDNSFSDMCQQAKMYAALERTK